VAHNLREKIGGLQNHIRGVNEGISICGWVLIGMSDFIMAEQIARYVPHSRLYSYIIHDLNDHVLVDGRRPGNLRRVLTRYE